VAESGVSEGLERFAFGWSRFGSVSPAGSPFRLINPDLGFLGASPFVAKTPGFGRCISLDFLGFSRPDRDLSMGYAKKPEKNFSSRFCRRERSVDGCPRFGHGEGTDCSWGKLNQISDFLQEIVTGAVWPGRISPK
jgi:hypothetical protein